MKQKNIKKELIQLTQDLIKFKTTKDHPEEIKDSFFLELPKMTDGKQQ